MDFDPLNKKFFLHKADTKVSDSLCYYTGTEDHSRKNDVVLYQVIQFPLHLCTFSPFGLPVGSKYCWVRVLLMRSEPSHSWVSGGSCRGSVSTPLDRGIGFVEGTPV